MWFSVGSLAAQEPDPAGNRDIGAVQLTSNQPGTIDAAWDAPEEAPTDYRIGWAKVGESYLTWTDSSGNAFPTSPSYTITGLEFGVRYKIRVRPRYIGIGGPRPWADEVEIEVMGSSTNTPPPPTSTPVPPTSTPDPTNREISGFVAPSNFRADGFQIAVLGPVDDTWTSILWEFSLDDDLDYRNALQIAQFSSGVVTLSGLNMLGACYRARARAIYDDDGTTYRGPWAEYEGNYDGKICWYDAPTLTPRPTNTPIPPPTNTPLPTSTPQFTAADKEIPSLWLAEGGASTTVEWSEPAYPPTEDYRFQWRESGGVWNTVIKSATGPRSHTLTLQSQVIYQFRIRARYTGESNGAWQELWYSFNSG